MQLVGEIVSMTKLNTKINQALDNVKDMRPAFVAIANDWYKDNKQIFDLEGPGMYEDLSPDYAEQKENDVGFMYPILKKSGRLEQSITNPDHMDKVMEMTPKSLVLGSNTPYGIYHQSKAPRKTLPYRPFIFNESTTGEAHDKFTAWYKRATRTIETYLKKQLNKISRGF